MNGWASLQKCPIPAMMDGGLIVVDSGLKIEFINEAAKGRFIDHGGDYLSLPIKDIDDRFHDACMTCQAKRESVFFPLLIEDSESPISVEVRPIDSGCMILWPSHPSELEAKITSSENLLQAISQANRILVSDGEYDTVLQECLNTIGEYVGIDRLSIYRCHPHSVTGLPGYSLRVRWSKESLAECHRTSNCSEMLWDPELTRWREMLQQGLPVSGLVSDLPESERLRMEGQGRKSILTMPIFVDKEWWGGVSFDDFSVFHVWNEAELTSIRALAYSIGSFISRRKTLSFLQQSEELHRMIVDNSKDVIFTLVPSGGLIFVSPSWKTSLGHDPDSVVGTRIDDFVHPEDVQKCYDYMLKIMSDPSYAGSVEYRIQGIDHKWRYHSATGSVVNNDEGVPEVIMGIAKDVTDRMEYEEKLQGLTQELTTANEALTEARDKALDASQAKSQFLANMSHEIRTPLNGVIGMTSLLLEQELDNEAHEMLLTVRASGETLLRVINDILDFSKIEAGKLDVEATEMSITTVIADVLTLYQEQARVKGIGLNESSPETLPPMVLGDPVRIRQVLSNLICNAIKFTHEGEVNLTWNWEQKQDLVSVRFDIQDSGVGIPADRLEAVFDRFTQAEDSTHRHYGGSGLGLAICRKLIDLMGGAIQAKSRVGVGSIFSVSLPMKLATFQHAQAPVVPIEWEPPRSVIRALLAEDNRVNVMVATRLLERSGCSVEVAGDGLEALSMALTNEYDVIFMDMEMPVCGGIEATRMIRLTEVDSDGHRTIIALTANAMIEDRQACISAGMDGFLTKPITLEALRQTLREWVTAEDVAA